MAANKKSALALALLLLISYASCKQPAREPENSIAYLSDPPWLQSSNTQAVSSVLESLSNENGFGYSLLKAGNESEMAALAKSAVEKNGLVFATSFATDKALIDAAFDDMDTIIACFGANSEESNVCNLSIRTEEAAFFAGIIAAVESKTGAVAYLGAYQNTSNDPMMAGFTAGAKTVRPDIQVFHQYVFSYNSPSLASTYISELINSSVDIIFADCGASIIGIEGTARSEKIRIICSDSFRYESEKTIAFLEIDLKPMVRDLVRMYLDKNLVRGASYTYGLDNKVFNYDLAAASQETKDEVDKYKVILFEFATDLPRNQDELDKFDFEYFRSVQFGI
jgi:basic membrane protein A